MNLYRNRHLRLVLFADEELGFVFRNIADSNKREIVAFIKVLSKKTIGDHTNKGSVDKEGSGGQS